MPLTAEAIRRGALDEIVGLHVRLAQGAIQRHFAEHFAELGLTQKQVSVLWLVGDNPRIAQTDIARLLQMDRATTMAIVHTLEKRSLLARKTHEHDARRIAFILSDAGDSVLLEAKAAVASHESWLRERFSAGEVSTLIELLRRIHD